MVIVTLFIFSTEATGDNESYPELKFYAIDFQLLELIFKAL